jgi:glycosyltransferase involved in cell wall biosynthesis
MKISFVLPGRGRSGGVRVTARMGAELLRSGHDVRLLWRRSHDSLSDRIKAALAGWRTGGNTDWLSEFKGVLQPYRSLSDVAFEPNEIVIAVGAMTVKDVYDLQQPVIKVRYNHGFSTYRPDLMKMAWSVPMTTLSVSSTCAAECERLSGQRVHAVVPNGIDEAEYYDMGLKRDGVGIVFSRHPNKRPDDILAILERIRNRRPAVPQYVFGEPRRPKEIRPDSYWRYPPVGKVCELYNRCKIWLLTSQDEGLPGPVLEAMACGTVVISTDNLGSAEIIRHEGNGILVPIGDVSRMMEWVDTLVEDDAMRTRIVEQGFETARGFTWEKAVKKMERALGELVRK